MNKKRIVIISIAVVIFLLLIAFIIINFGSKSNEFKIHVTTNGGVPYQWKYADLDENIEFVEEKSNARNSLAGGIVDEYFYFRVKDKVTTNVTMNYTDIRDGSVSEKRVYKVKYNGWLKPSVVRVK